MTYRIETDQIFPVQSQYGFFSDNNVLRINGKAFDIPTLMNPPIKKLPVAPWEPWDIKIKELEQHNDNLSRCNSNQFNIIENLKQELREERQTITQLTNKLSATEQKRDTLQKRLYQIRNLFDE